MVTHISPLFAETDAPVGVLALLGAVLLCYFLPFGVALLRGHPHALAIFVINLFFGATFVGWVVALVWACVSPASSPVVQIIQTAEGDRVVTGSPARSNGCFALFIGTVVVATVLILIGLFYGRAPLREQLRNWWKHAGNRVEMPLAPPADHERLTHELERLDHEFDKHLDALAAADVGLQAREGDLVARREAHAKLHTEIANLTQTLEGKIDQCDLGDRASVAAPIARRLEGMLRTYEAQDAVLKTQAKVLAARQQAQASARQRLGKLRGSLQIDLRRIIWA